MGPLSLDHLRLILAVETYHTEFHSDNLPSVSILDCCLGLARLDDPQLGFGASTKVTFVHSTLNAYLDSNPATLESVLPDLVSACFAFLSFDPHQQPSSILSLITNSWVRLLHAMKDPPPDLLEAAWGRCVAINNRIGQHSSSAPSRSKPHDGKSVAEVSALLPRQTLRLKSKDQVPRPDASERRDGQTLFHTVCMLGLDEFDPILNHLRELVKHKSFSRKYYINSLDTFGISSLGWVLISETHFDSYLERSTRALPSPLDSFERNLGRAERLIANFPVLAAGRSLWDKYALKTLDGSRGSYRDGHRIDYFSSHPFLFFIGNYSVSPSAVSRCITRMGDLGFNFWSSVRSTPVRSLPRRSDPAVQTNRTWSIVLLKNFELTPSTDSWTLDRDEVDDPPPTGSEVVDEKAKYSRKNVAALFEPDKDIPVLVTAGWGDKHDLRVQQYCSKRGDVGTEVGWPLPSTECWSMSMPREALLHVAAAAGSVDIISHLLSISDLEANFLDNDHQTASHVALRSQSYFSLNYLLRHPDTDLSIQDIRRQSLLHLCAQYQLVGPASIILGRCPMLVDLQDHQGKTALHYAVDKGMRKMIGLLIRSKADANIEDASGHTALHAAIIERDAAICDILLEPRPNADFSARNLRTAWKLAIQAGAAFIMTLLRVIQRKPQDILLLGHNADPASSALASVPEMRVLQAFLAADRTSSFMEKDLDFMLQLTHAAGPSSSTALALVGNSPRRISPTPPGSFDQPSPRAPTMWPSTSSGSSPSTSTTSARTANPLCTSPSSTTARRSSTSSSPTAERSSTWPVPIPWDTPPSTWRWCTSGQPSCACCSTRPNRTSSAWPRPAAPRR